MVRVTLRGFFSNSINYLLLDNLVLYFVWKTGHHFPLKINLRGGKALTSQER